MVIHCHGRPYLDARFQTAPTGLMASMVFHCRFFIAMAAPTGFTGELNGSEIGYANFAHALKTRMAVLLHQ